MILPLSNKKNVSKLPEEFKRGFTIFYVRDISQVYKVCFETTEAEIDQGKFENLKEAGIEVERYEEDTMTSKLLFEEEADILASRNFIEELM